MTFDKPLAFRPIFKSAIWGGRRLADMFADAPAEGPIAEAWILSDVAGNASVGPDQVSIRTLMTQHVADILGPNAPTHFPLLVKIIDANLPLSVQVHPNDAAAQRSGEAMNGKTEAWVVLHSEPGSRIYAGIKAGTTAQTIRDSLPVGPVDHWLHSFEPKIGDAVFLPAGTVHALGGGIVIAEVQQTSDVTYRLFDWGRRDPKTGQSRELHVDQALDCIDYSAGPVEPIRGRRSLVKCPYFELIRHDDSSISAGPGGRILIGLHGTAQVNGLQLGAGQLLLIPSRVDARIEITSGSVLEVRIPTL